MEIEKVDAATEALMVGSSSQCSLGGLSWSELDLSDLGLTQMRGAKDVRWCRDHSPGPSVTGCLTLGLQKIGVHHRAEHWLEHRGTNQSVHCSNHPT